MHPFESYGDPLDGEPTLATVTAHGGAAKDMP
jgi:hypothetical protein